MLKRAKKSKIPPWNLDLSEVEVLLRHTSGRYPSNLTTAQETSPEGVHIYAPVKRRDPETMAGTLHCQLDLLRKNYLNKKLNIPGILSYLHSARKTDHCVRRILMTAWFSYSSPRTLLRSLVPLQSSGASSSLKSFFL